ncbi:MAG: Na/Pi symporter [Brumimicrobium sp.]
MYEDIKIIIVIISAISLFIFGLQSFSKEIQNIGTERLSTWIKKITKLPLGGFFLGGIITAVIQSSTMVSSLTVTLVNSGVIGFKDSILILLGTNIGNTSTAWIVSANSYLIGPIFIVLGSMISLVPTKLAVAGKSIFYFGFIFFSLTLLSDAMEPIKNNVVLLNILSHASHPLMGILYGIMITVLIQSSSIVVGLVIVLVTQGSMDIGTAIPIVIGANIGTTSTALLVSMKFSSLSKIVALAASLFNLVGVIFMIPLFGVLESIAVSFSSEPALQVAIAFTISNTVNSVFFLIFLKPTLALLKKHRWYKQHLIEQENNV